MNFEPKVKPLERITRFYIASLLGTRNFQDTTTMKIGGKMRFNTKSLHRYLANNFI